MSNPNNTSKAYLYSAVEPTESQMAGFVKFLSEKYEHEVKVIWVETREFPGGFRLEIGNDVYDWSKEGKFEQLREKLTELVAKTDNVIPLMKERAGNGPASPSSGTKGCCIPPRSGTPSSIHFRSRCFPH